MLTNRNWITLIIIVLFLASTQSLAQEDLPKLVRKIQPAIVTVITYDVRGKEKSIASGFFINPRGQFLTNYHVLSGAIRVELKTLEGQHFIMKRVVVQDKVGDLVIGEIKSPQVDLPYLNLSNSSPEIGERVIVIGSPLGLEQTLSDGLISAVRHIPNFGNILQITAPISPGSSGSPVINLKGEVIGVATFLFKEGQNLNFAIPASRVIALTTSRKAKRTRQITSLPQHLDKPIPSRELTPSPSKGSEEKYLRDFLGNEIKKPISIVGKINCAGCMNGYFIESSSFKSMSDLPGIMIVNYDEELLDILYSSGRISRFNGLTNKAKSVIFIDSIDGKKYIGKLRPHLLQTKQSNGMEFTLTGKIYISAVMGFAMEADNGVKVSFGEELPEILENILKQAERINRKVTIIGTLFPKEGIRGSNYFHVSRIGFEGEPLLPVPKYSSKN